MATDTGDQGSPQGKGEGASLRRGVAVRFVQVGLVFLLQAAVLFISSGRLDWIAAWVYLGVYLCVLIVNVVILVPHNPELVAERGQIKDDAKDWDKTLSALVGQYLPLTMLILCGLDQRYGWSPQPDLPARVVALIVLVLGYGLVSWAMASNPFFSSVVRIQTDRGHTVATSGPYRFVRHPGYLGMMAFTLATPVLLGSFWALIVAAIDLYLIAYRTNREDRTLQDELPGYRDYAKRVRYRLLPGVW
jgi:protein-S-isoprenylcysteine O-methyltransferase Ste14